MAAEAFGRTAIRRLRSPLIRWYRRHKRDLPWRRTRDPYAIWVSEVMLQQTTVAAVVPYWERFLDRFPDVETLAAAREDDVLAAWSGLGYYSRARNLRRGAIAVMERHHGSLPDTTETLLSLPGIGRYTAGAIASLAFAAPAPIVDGNVKRVFARVFAIGTPPGPGLDRTAWSVAEALVPGRDPGDLNQAIMELGATVCTPRAPRCGDCPLARECAARAAGSPEAYPARRTTAAARSVLAAAAWIERRGKVLLERRHPGAVLRGEWDVPIVAVPAGRDARRALARALETRHHLTVGIGGRVARIRHAILDDRLTIDVYRVTLEASLPRSSRLRFVSPLDLDRVAHSGATRKVVAAAQAPAPEPQKRSHRSRSSGRASSSSGAMRRSNA
ncbi:MAG TPA: A/G-specific adenine glycosylase [Candidatus Sulfotelmatobacter sp.]|jgi:A/G-specific adenine glycosylase|nr:A/G-specific adenine glycosylase [Candidatus Sulfotelmatobacter sp.]